MIRARTMYYTINELTAPLYATNSFFLPLSSNCYPFDNARKNLERNPNRQLALLNCTICREREKERKKDADAMAGRGK